MDTEKGVFRSGKDHMSNLRENSPRQPTHIVEKMSGEKAVMLMGIIGP